MAGGPKLSDYKMTEKEYILAETIVEMTDKSELFRIGFENLGWSEIEVIPTENSPHNLRYILKQESWIELVDAAAEYIKLNLENGYHRTAEHISRKMDSVIQIVRRKSS